MLGAVEGAANLVGGGAIPGAIDYVPFLDPLRAKYDTPAFGTTIEVLTGVGAFKALGEIGTASKVSVPTERYNRQLHYGGSQTNSPTAQAARAAGENQPCPTCGQTQISGTNTAPSPQHDPPLVKHYYENGGHAMSDAERRAYAKDEGINGTQCITCQRKEGRSLMEYSREIAKELGF